ncbi:receptor-like protein 19 [Corylus avellana]|uniref:receptor-like protein 19 n=1 Tax=Corylus avellana TaxID=13451 RepID=UPI00286ACEFA|nr:receptor-like protein 19 [Corylus avellana]
MLQGALSIPPASTKIYQVGWNKVSEISPLICNLSSLSELDLSHNNLRGILHPCLGNFSPFLSVLELRSNNFHGTIPKTWANSSSLRVIDLSQNQLEGPLPRSLANSAMLEYLHVGNNKIIGTFPFWLRTLPQLKVLVLHSNGFYGAIRSSESNYTFPKLRIIDLSCNNFSGHLPAEYFLHWTAMKAADANQLKYMIARTTGDWWYSDFAYSIAIANKGIEIEYQKIQDVFTVIDFSSNRFEGEIPYLLESLKGLYLLNLSNNAFTGHIPSSLGNLTQLESMDLSRNKLSGIIPPQLAELNFLSSFNVSNNRLTGPIPHGEQFDTFENSSFSGNLGLYGKPLSKQCDTLPPSTSEENQGSESSLEFDWKVVVMGYGCGLVVGAVIGKFVTIRKFMRSSVKRQQTPRWVNRRM